MNAGRHRPGLTAWGVVWRLVVGVGLLLVGLEGVRELFSGAVR